MALFYGVTASRQTNIRGFSFGSVPITALLVYLFQLVPVIFTYLRADCPFDVTTFLDLTSFRLLRVGSGHRVKSHRVGSGRGSKILTRFHLYGTFAKTSVTVALRCRPNHFCTYFHCPSCPSVCLSVRPSLQYELVTRKQRSAWKSKFTHTFATARVSGVLVF